MAAAYGHNYSQGNGIFIDGWGAGPYIITAGGKLFYFEDSRQFGPVRLTSKGDIADNGVGFFPEKSPFWSVWKRWVDEGRQTQEGKKRDWLYCVVSNGRRAA